MKSVGCAQCHVTTHTVVVNNQIVFKCKKCVQDALEMFDRSKVTLWILLRRRRHMSRDMAKKICQCLDAPIQTFGDDKEEGMQVFSECAKFYTSLDEPDFVNFPLQSLKHVEVDVSPLTIKNFRRFSHLLARYAFQNIVARWDFSRIDEDLVELIKIHIKPGTTLTITVPTFGFGMEQKPFTIEEHNAILRVLPENDV